MNDNSPVTVNIRIRPKEHKEKSILNITKNENDVKFLIAGDKGFVFDQIFEESVTQEEIYNSAVNPLVCNIFKGYSCIVLAYGQTGTGKTYTMIGDTNDNSEHAGLISRVINDLFIMTPENSNEMNVKIEISFVEIYNQKVFDLLGHNRSAQVVKNLSLDETLFREVKTPEEGQQLLQFGRRHRHVGETKLNAKSSRSHAVFVIKYITERKDSSTTSKIYLVDLGGSESVKRTGNEGVARLEGISINQSLLALRKVLIALSKNEKLVPYRDSILTSILHDSLTVKNYICLIACISSDRNDYSETINTLRFAESTKQIKSRPEIETIYNQFKQQNPEIIEDISALIPSVAPTPMKRKYDCFATPFRSTKRALKQSNNNLMNDNCTDTVSKKPYIPDLSEKFDGDFHSLFNLNVSSSTVAEFSTISLSPIIKKCTEIVEEKMENYIALHFDKNQKRRSVYKSPLVKTPELNKGINYTNEMMTQLVKTINDNMSRLIDSKLKIFEDMLPQRRLFVENINSDENEDDFQSPPKTIKQHVGCARVPISQELVLTDITSEEISKENICRNEKQNPLFKTVRRSARLNYLVSPNVQKSTPAHFTTNESLNKKNVKNIENEYDCSSYYPVRQTRQSVWLESKSASQELISTNFDCNRSVNKTVRRSQRLNVMQTTSPKNEFKVPLYKPVRAKKAQKIPVEQIKENAYSLPQHKKSILHILNTGSKLQLQDLPTVGLKTSQQIYMYRLLHGQFNSINDLKTAPFWRGKQFDRFLEANFLV